jgi:SAM-dependent methyltransferase
LDRNYDTYWNYRISTNNINVMPRHIEIVNIIKENKPEGKVLDLGCGEGHVLNRLTENFERYGCDISEKPLYFLDNDVNTKICNLNEGFPFNNIFDVIVCSELLEHLENPEDVLQNISQHLKPDGLSLITIPNYKNTRLGGGDPFHLHGWKISDFCKVLKANGLTVEKFYPTYFKWRGFSTIGKPILNRFLRCFRFLYDLFGEQNLFICKKHKRIYNNGISGHGKTLFQRISTRRKEGQS